MNLAWGSRLKTRLKTRLNTFSRHLPLAVQPLHHRLSPSSVPHVPCKPASLELAAASRPSFLPPEAFNRPPLELTFYSLRLFLGKPLAVCITPIFRDMPWGTKGLLPLSAPLQIANSEKTWSKNVIEKHDPHESRIGFALKNALENALKPLFLPPSARCPTSPPPPFAFFCTTCPLSELAAASRPSFLPPEAFDRPPLELTFRSLRLFLGKPLAVYITPIYLKE